MRQLVQKQSFKTSLCPPLRGAEQQSFTVVHETITLDAIFVLLLYQSSGSQT